MRVAFESYDKLLPLKELKASKHQRNKHPDDQLERLAKIMREHGVRHPIHISKLSGEVCFGHGRWEAAKLNGWKEFPVVYQDFKDDKEEYACVQSDNAIAHWAELDLSLINDDLLKLGDEFDIELLGIKDLAVIAPSVEPQCDEDEVPEHVEPLAKLGDVYSLGRHRVMCGDSTSVDAVEKLMDGEKADMVFTDPPYGVSYEQGKFTGQKPKNKFKPIANDEKRGSELYDFLLSIWGCIHAVTDVCVVYSWSPPLLEGAEILNSLVDSGFHIQSQIIWDKKRLVLGRADYQWRHEICWYGYKGKNHYWCGDRDQTSVWEQKRDSEYKHPTQKPVELGERAINNSCKRDGNIIDLFGGSGSTLIACEKTNRKCFMMELDPHYVDVIVARWKKYTGKKAELLNGET